MWCILIMISFIFILLFLYVFYPYYFILNINEKRSLISKNIIDSDIPYYKHKIITSHNTFVRGFQIFDASSYNSIRRALRAGARAIEFDIHPSRDDPNIPIVSHAAKIFDKLIYFTTPLPLESCLDIVNEFTYKTSDPIVIFLQLETNDNPILQKNIADIFKKVFGNKLLDNKYKLSKSPFFLEPIKNLLNKVIVIAGLSSKQIIGLEDIIDCTLYGGNIINKDHINALDVNNINQTKLARVYRKGGVFSELSLNYDPYDYWNKHYQFVAINLQRNGAVLYNYLRDFDDSNTSFIPFN